MSKEPDAETVFRGILQACQVLSGKSNGHGFVETERARLRLRPAGSERAPVVSQVTIGASRARRGTEVGVYFAYERTCGACRSEGIDSDASTESCGSCSGAGWARDGGRVRIPAAGHVDAADNVGDGFLIVHVTRHVSPEARAVRALAALGVIGGLVLLGLMVTQSL